MTRMASPRWHRSNDRSDHRRDHRRDQRRTPRLAAVTALATFLVGTVIAGALTACFPTQTRTQDPSASSPANAAASSEADAERVAALAKRPAVRGYSFPPGMVATPGIPSFTPLEGVISLPSTPGPHPVAIIVHGSYPACLDLSKAKLITRDANTTEWTEVCPAERTAYGHKLTLGPDYLRASASFGYLAQELASRGIATIAVDVHAKERFSWSRDASPFDLQTAIVRAHLDTLARLNSGDPLGLPWGGDLKGRLDLSSLALLGHSTGGGYAVEVAAQRPFPGLRAVVALQPGQSNLDRQITDLVPTLLITAQCDEQVAQTGLDTAKELAQAAPKSVVLSVSAPRTTHIGVLSGGGSHEVGPVDPVRTKECANSALLTPDQMTGSTALLAADFVATTLKGTTAYALGTGPGLRPEAKSWTSAASVTLVDQPLPPIVRAKDIAFARSDVAILPPPTPDVQIGHEGQDFEGSYQESLESATPSP